MGKIVSINVSKNKGEKKTPVTEAFVDEHGIKGDGHSGKWHRQVSLLSYESLKELNKKGVSADCGDFQAADELGQIAPVRADVSHDPRRTTQSRVNAPIVVGVV